MKSRRWQLFSAVCGSLHDLAVVVTRSAIEVTDRHHCIQSLMLLVTRGAGAIRDDVRLIEIVLLMTFRAGAIDPFARWRAVFESVVQHLKQSRRPAGGTTPVALRHRPWGAAVLSIRMRTR